MSAAEPIPVQVRRRRRESRRCEPLACGRRDPADPHFPTAWTLRSDYGLSREELRRHANGLHAAGWSIAEICATLAVEPAGAP